LQPKNLYGAWCQDEPNSSKCRDGLYIGRCNIYNNSILIMEGVRKIMAYTWLCARKREDDLWWIYSLNMLLESFGGFPSKGIAEEVICAICCKQEIKRLIER